MLLRNRVRKFSQFSFSEIEGKQQFYFLLIVTLSKDNMYEVCIWCLLLSVDLLEFNHYLFPVNRISSKVHELLQNQKSTVCIKPDWCNSSKAIVAERLFLKPFGLPVKDISHCLIKGNTDKKSCNFILLLSEHKEANTWRAQEK